MEPLAQLRQMDFVPGTNRRGHAGAAAWTYLLPSQQLGTVVCVGRPTGGALERLHVLAKDVRLIDAGTGSPGTAFAAPIDLLWLVGGRVSFDRRTRAAWVGSLAKRARLVYRERWALAHSGRRGEQQARAGRLAAWLTPLFGEPRAAVPLEDQLTIRHFRSRGLDERWLDRELERRGIRLGARLAAVVVPGPVTELVERVGVLSGEDAPRPGAAPRYVLELAAQAGVDLNGYRWGLSAKGQYASRKSLIFLYRGTDYEPQVIAKISQKPAFNGRLENSYHALRLLQETGFGGAGRAPRARFAGSAGRLQVVAEDVITGADFVDVSSGSPTCPFARDALQAIVDLARARVTPAHSRQLAEAVQPLLVRFAELYAPSQEVVGLLQRQVEGLATSRADMPLVFVHGDPGTNNLLVRPDGRVALLDWENADPVGPPLWDLFHFARSYAVWTTRRRARITRTAAARSHFLSGSPLTGWIADAVNGYRRDLALDASLIEPLFWLHLMVQALREAPRLDRQRMNNGQYVRLIEMFAADANAPALRLILRGEPGG